MSKGFGIRQRQIIEHLENAQGYTDTTTNIINKIIKQSPIKRLKNTQGSERNPPAPLERSIFNAFTRLVSRKVIFPCKTRNIYQPLAKTYTLNKENIDYKKYRKTWSHA